MYLYYKTISLSLFIGLLFTATCQQDDLLCSGIVDKTSNQEFRAVFSTDEKATIVASCGVENKNHLYLDQLDSNLVKVWSKKHELPVDEIIAIEQVGGKIVAFTAFHDKTKKLDMLNAFTIGVDGALSSTILLSKFTPNGGYHNTFKISVSPDGKHVGVINEMAYIKDKNEQVVLQLFNKDLLSKQIKNLTYHNMNTKKKVNVPVTNNNGLMYVIKRHRIKSNNKYMIFTLGGSGEEHHELKLRSRSIADVRYGLNKDGDLILAGFFTSPIRFNFEGVFFASFKGHSTPEVKKEYYLTESVVNEFKSKKEIAKMGFGLDGFRVKKLIVDENGQSFLIAEHHDIHRDGAERTDFHKGIVAFKFTRTGDFLWGAPVLTRQKDESAKGYWSSSVPFVKGGKLHVLFNEIGYFDKKANNEFGENVELGVRECIINEAGVTTTNPYTGVFGECSGQKYSLQTASNLRLENGLLFLGESKDQAKYCVIRKSFE